MTIGKKTWQQIATGILFVLSQNLRLIFTLDENLRQIRYDNFCQDDVCFNPLFRNVNGNKD